MYSKTYWRECGARLASVRQHLGYDSIRAFAELTGVGEDALGSWESGKRRVPYYYIRRLKRRYGVTFDWIYDGDPSGLPRSLAERIPIDA